MRRPRVNDVAVGIALMLFGMGLAFFLGKPLIGRSAAAARRSRSAGGASPQVRAALQINVLFVVGVMLAVVLAGCSASTRWGLVVRTVGESADAARAMGYDVNRVRMLATRLADFSRASAGRSSRSITPAAGTKASPAARA